MNRRTWFGLAAFAAVASLAPALMAPTGGYPSAPTFQRVGIGAAPGSTNRLLNISGTPGPYIAVSDTSQAANARATILQSLNGSPALIVCNDAFAVCSGVLGSTRSGTAVATVTLGNATDNPTFSVNGVTLTPLSGSFVASFDAACTTTPTATYAYQKLGNVVTIEVTATSGFNCTADVSNFDTTGTPVPAALRPATATVFGPQRTGAFDNGTAVCSQLSITTAGNIAIRSLNCASGNLNTWTAAGARGFGNNDSFTYMINN